MYLTIQKCLRTISSEIYHSNQTIEKIHPWNVSFRPPLSHLQINCTQRLKSQRQKELNYQDSEMDEKQASPHLNNMQKSSISRIQSVANVKEPTLISRPDPVLLTLFVQPVTMHSLT